MDSEYDIVVIGAGATGREAAEMLNRSGTSRTWAVFSNGERPAAIPEARFVAKQVTTVFSLGQQFSLAVGADIVTARTVIIATGPERIPPIPGEREFYGRGVSVCAECDGLLYRNRRVAVSAPPSRIGEVAHLAASEQVLVFTDGLAAGDNVTVISGRLTQITGERVVSGVIAADGSAIPVDGVFILKDELAPHLLVPGIQTDSEDRIVVDRGGRTNLAGCFAAGSVAAGADVSGRTAAEGALDSLSTTPRTDKNKQ